MLIDYFVCYTIPRLLHIVTRVCQDKEHRVNSDSFVQDRSRIFFTKAYLNQKESTMVFDLNASN